MNIIKGILKSKTAYLVMFAHWFLCALAIYEREGLSHRFHLYYEPFLFKLVVLLDLFWLSLAEAFSKKTEVVFIVGFLLAGVQWFLIGYFIGKIKTNKLK